MKVHISKTICCLFLILFLNLTFSVSAQTAEAKKNFPANVSDYKLNSKAMKREIPYRVILPVGYKNSNDKTLYPVVYLLHGLTGHFSDWAERTKLVAYAAKYNRIIVMPEGANGWYTDSTTSADDRYETYIIQELVPEIDKNFRTVADRNHRAIAGLSMGGYGAIKFGLKHPDAFILLGSFSGALGAAAWTEKEIGTKGVIAESILSVYGAADSETRRQNDIFKIIKELPNEKISSLPFLYLDCGSEDFLINNNRDFAALLLEKKVPHEFRQLPGAHDWKYWDAQIQEFFELSEKFIK